MNGPTAGEPLDSRSHVLVHPVSSSSAPEAHALVNAIRTHPQHDAAPLAFPPSPRTRSTPPHYLPWRISNKYYRASVAFRVVAPSDAVSDKDEDLRASLPEGDEPAVVVVAPTTALPSNAVTALLERLSSRQPEFDVALLVTHPPSATPTSSSTSSSPRGSADGAAEPGGGIIEVDEAAWDEAALSAGFEWVHLGAAPREEPRAPSANGELDGEDEDEDGESPIGRIVAALHAHMWHSMERVERPARAAPARSSAPVNGAGALGYGEAEEDDADEEEWSALGAPPLPAPRVRPGEDDSAAQWTFPDRFLPSIARPATSASGVAGERGDSAATARTSPSFEDDFAPFVSASSSTTSFDPFMRAEALGSRTAAPSAAAVDVGAASASSTGASPPYRHPSLAFPDSTVPSSTSARPLPPDDPSLGPADADLDSLDDLFSCLSTARAATASMDLDERRAYAERVVRDLLGEDALGGLSGSDEEGEEDEKRREVGL
ncbi:hypothetical protein JCM9279_003049 [Rhodotorula babjevae]